MQYVIVGALAIAVLYGLVQALVNLPTQTLVRIVRLIVGLGLIGVGALLIFARQFGFGIGAIIVGIAALYRGRIGPLNLGGASRSAGKTSSVRSRFIETSLDHDSGDLRGMVREGQFAGRALDDLDEQDLAALAREIAGDTDSEALLEAYLDRRFPGGRTNAENDPGPRPGGATQSGAMTDEEAYQVLGLSPGAGEAEIRAAHRRLLKGVHPDQGGSTFLAARINQAKDQLLRRHR
jgi:hypothetical protein